MTELLVPWHFYLQVLAACAVLPFVACRWRGSGGGRRSRLREHVVAGVVLTALLASTALHVEMKQRRRGDRAASYAAAEWIRELPSGTRLAMADSWYVQLIAGPSYHVFDLTGLVTDRRSLSLLQAKDYDTVFEEQAIEYLLGFEGGLAKYGPARVIQRDRFRWDGQVLPFVLAARDSAERAGEGATRPPSPR
jgi:hypothetical protein